VIVLPHTSPRPANLRSPGRYLLGLAAAQRRTLVAAGAVEIVWMLSQAMLPFVIGSTLDAGVLHRDGSAIVTGCLTLLGLGLVISGFGMLAHRLSVSSWLQSALTSLQYVGHHTADHGGAVAAVKTTGEVIEAAAGDSDRIGNLMESLGRAIGSIAAYAAVTVAVIRMDLLAGLWVAAGVPVMTATLSLLVRPLNTRESSQRELEGRLTALGADTVAGLRVLRGIGGEPQFVSRYAERSQQVRAAGIRVAVPRAALEGASVLLPGVFVVSLIWLGAHGVLSGRLTPGELLSLYGSAAFLRLPLEAASESLFNLVTARVAATRVVEILRQTGTPAGDSGRAELRPMPGPGAVLVDPQSGVQLVPGQLTAVVAAEPELSSEIADRLGGFATSRGTEPVPHQRGTAATGRSPLFGGVPLDELDLDAVRAEILVSEPEPRLFTGSLRDQLDPQGRRSTSQILAALEVADAGDVMAALPDGLDSPVDERGRNFSGGQRQRLALARAILAEPEVLVLVEPTSAVDAHTEARLAQRLRAARAGRTTLIATASPLVLAQCDRVLLLDESGAVASEGTHQHLISTSASYRNVVTRGEELE
jgi:ABC-type multidrug transport system fused ATPase/permease subunit